MASRYTASMQEETAAYLIRLNRTFYDTFAEAFSHSRGESEPGLWRILREVPPGSRVLDLGCGQGRVCALLPEECRYTGMDFSSEMLSQARLGAEAAGRRATFIQGELTDAVWPPFPEAAYDWIILRAVLHHIPRYAARLAILKQAAERLADKGQLVLANWQFLSVPRLQKRVRPWSDAGLSETDVEPGDYLLDWRREGQGLRYVHLVDLEETLRLAADAGLCVGTHFTADGREGNLTLYALLK